MAQGFIYLASPYSHHDPAVRELRALKAADAALGLIERGHVVYSPIAAWHPWTVTSGLPFTYEHWKAQDQAMIHAADALWVLMMHPWEQSVGVTAEIAYAKRLGMPVCYVNPDTLEVFNSPPLAA